MALEINDERNSPRNAVAGASTEASVMVKTPSLCSRQRDSEHDEHEKYFRRRTTFSCGPFEILPLTYTCVDNEEN